MDKVTVRLYIYFLTRHPCLLQMLWSRFGAKAWANVIKIYEFLNKLGFVPGRPFQPSLCGFGQEPTIEWNIWKVLHSGWLSGLTYTVDLTGKACHRQILTYFVNWIVYYGRKKLPRITCWKLAQNLVIRAQCFFTGIIYNVHRKLSQMWWIRPGTYPRVKHSARLWPYLQTIDQAGKACQGQMLILLRNYGRMKFWNIGPSFDPQIKNKRHFVNTSH